MGSVGFAADVGVSLLALADTVAVETAVGGTRAAGGNQRFFEGLASAVDADGCVRNADVIARGEVGQRRFLQVHIAKDIRVIWLERRQHSGDALADDIARQIVRLYGGFKLVCPLRESAVFEAAMPVEVDDGVAQDAVEPCGARLSAAQFSLTLQGTEIGVLQDIFGNRGR